MTVRCVGMKFEFAEYLEKQSNKMRKLFYDMSKHRDAKEILEFLREFEENVNEHITEKRVRDLIFGNLAAFGPNRFGPNMLLLTHLVKEESLLEKLRSKANSTAISCQSKCLDSTEEKTSSTTSSSIAVKLSAFKK